MWARCGSPKHEAHPRYSHLPVQLDWCEFANFLRDMGPRPEGTTLDRRDNARGYTAGNCRWATSAEQIANRKNTVWVGGKPAAVASKLLGLSGSTIYKRMTRDGMSADEALQFARPRWAHGTRHGYETGCRCQDCRAAHAAHHRARRARRKN